MSTLKSMMVAFAVVSTGLVVTSAAAPAAEAQNTKVVLVDQNYVINAAEGLKDITTKVQNISTQIDAELNPERTALQSERQSLQARAGSRTPEQLQQDAAFVSANEAFVRKVTAFGEKEFIRGQELIATRDAAIQELTNAMYTVIDTVRSEANAQLVLERTSAVSFDEAIDVTETVLLGLNQQMPTVTVSRRTFTEEERQNVIAQAAQQQQQQQQQLLQQGLAQQQVIQQVVQAQQRRQQQSQ